MSNRFTPYPTGFFALTDAATIAVNAALGDYFRVTLSATRILGNPSNPVNGQLITVEIIQPGGGACNLTYDTKYAFSTNLPAPTLTGTASKRAFIAFRYNSTADLWYCLAFNEEF